VTGHIVQINTSRGNVPKRPVVEAMVTPLGVVGDSHDHPRVHGGPRQALLLMTVEGIDELVAQGFPLYPGALGENLTTRGIDRKMWRIGQRWRAGDVIFELTKIRIPCTTIDVYGAGIGEAMYDPEVRAGDHTSTLWGLSGIYASVVQPGTVRTGDPISLVSEFA
jgi:MOSC domain-containing protein YiiM